jgi:tetratricopeptide (TPR) repeat protein
MSYRLRYICAAAILVIFPPLYAQDRAGNAEAAFRGGNYAETVSICQKEIEADASNIDAYQYISSALVKLGRYEEAQKYAETGRKLNRFNTGLVETLGEACYFQGKNTEALAFFEEYINLAPEGSMIEQVYYYTGEVFIRMGRFRHADIIFATALHYAPANARWWTRLGYARERCGELARAVKAYEQALLLDNKLSDARRGLERVRNNLSQ